MRIAVIGSNSFSGASFVDFALAQGAEVIGISRSPEPAACFLPYRWSGRDSGFRFYAHDLNQDLDGLMARLDAERPGIVVNFAAQGMVGESWLHPEHWFQTNVVGTVALHDRLRRRDYLDRYVHVTTPEVYGSSDDFIREDAPYNPTTPYAVSRAAGDMSLRSFVKAYGFPAVLTRAANVYGPGQQLYRIIPRTVLFLLTGRTLELHGGGTSRRAFIHIRDVADATWQVMTAGEIGGCYHISTREIVTIRALVERICARMGKSFDENVRIVGERMGTDAAYLLDTAKIRDQLGWSDRIGLDAGIDEVIAWAEARRDQLEAQPLSYIHKP